MRRFCLTCLFVLLLTRPAFADNVRLHWDPNSEPDLAGYVLVWGAAPDLYTASATLPATATSHEVTGLAPGVYYFAIRAFNTGNLFSGYSNVVRVEISSDGTPPVVSKVRVP